MKSGVTVEWALDAAKSTKNLPPWQRPLLIAAIPVIAVACWIVELDCRYGQWLKKRKQKGGGT
jgi:hypothetical protein